MKIVNVKGIIILAAVIVAIQLAGGLIISPVLSPIIIENINKAAATKITAEKITVWPVTLSCSLKNLKVFDPDNEQTRIALIKSASMRLSLLALLSKRIVISRFDISGAEINLIGEADGSFNVQRLGKTEGESRAAGRGLFGGFEKQEDWFGRIYEGIKQKSSKEAADKRAAQEKQPKAIEKDIVQLPKGRVVNFIKPADNYIFEIKGLSVKDSKITLKDASGQSVDIDKAALYIKNLRAGGPAGAAGFDAVKVSGVLNKNGKASGDFRLDYSQSYSNGRQMIESSLSAKDVDLTAIKFIYADSVPVDFEKGTISMACRANISDGSLDSQNSITLKDQVVNAKNNSASVGFVPLPLVCDALNKISPVDIKFRITGTVENPQFEGLEETILNLVKPYLADIKESIKNQGLSKTIDSIKSLFGGKDEQE